MSTDLLLLESISEKNLELLEQSIKKGADTGLVSSLFSFSTLHMAVSKCFVQAIPILIKNRGDINHKNQFDQTPLYYSIEYAIKEKSKPGDLHNTDYYDYLEMAAILLKNGADVNIGKNPLELLEKHPDTYRALDSLLRDMTDRKMSLYCLRSSKQGKDPLPTNSLVKMNRRPYRTTEEKTPLLDGERSQETAHCSPACLLM